MDGGPELHWFNDRPEQQFTPLEIAAMEFGDALVDSIVREKPVPKKYMAALSKEAAKEAKKKSRMKMMGEKTHQEVLEELKQELLRDFGGGKV